MNDVLLSFSNCLIDAPQYCYLLPKSGVGEVLDSSRCAHSFGKTMSN